MHQFFHDITLYFKKEFLSHAFVLVFSIKLFFVFLLFPVNLFCEFAVRWICSSMETVQKSTEAIKIWPKADCILSEMMGCCARWSSHRTALSSQGVRWWEPPCMWYELVVLWDGLMVLWDDLMVLWDDLMAHAIISQGEMMWCPRTVSSHTLRCSLLHRSFSWTLDLYKNSGGIQRHTTRFCFHLKSIFASKITE